MVNSRINNTINESSITPETIKQRQRQLQNNATTARNILTGSFIGAGDGFHNVEGLARVIPLGDGSTILRLENFKSTNGPNVHLYLATDKDASNFIDLGRLKANNGNQNYNIPHGTDLAKYNMVLDMVQGFLGPVWKRTIKDIVINIIPILYLQINISDLTPTLYLLGTYSNE